MEANEVAERIGFPIILRPSLTLGGSGGGVAYNKAEFDKAIRRAFQCSPIPECLIEESLLGWKEYELEVIRDNADNFGVICTIENFDPMGVHTGDSITVAPAMTLTDREYQRLRDAGRAIITEIGVDTGGITGTSSAFEPTIDYVVTKVPRFAFEKFAGADPRLTTQMS